MSGSSVQTEQGNTGMTVRYNDDGTISTAAGRAVGCSSCWGSGFTLTGKECGCGAAARRMADWFKDARDPAATERQAIAKWLREEAAAANGDGEDEIMLDYMNRLANAIERGEHLK